MIAKSEWIWMPHAGHLIVARSCQFHLNTWVGNYIVSTVGEYWPDREVRKIFAESRGIQIVGRGDAWDQDYRTKMGFEPIGADRTYETMVFPARISLDMLEPGHTCCLYTAASWAEQDMNGYNTASDAYQGHLELCKKWSRMPKAIIHDD